MPSATMPPGGGYQVNGLWYTPQEWQAMGGAAGLGVGSAPNQSAIDGRAALQEFINEMDLQGLNINDAWAAYVRSGSNIDYWANTWLPTTKVFQTQYPAYQQLMQEGRGITVAQYRDYKNTLMQEAHSAGFPDGVVSNDTITSWLLGDVSAAEGQQRILDAGKAANQLDTNSQAYLMKNELGLSNGDLAAIFFDPTKALPVLENKLAAAQIGGAAANAGISLGTSTADQLAKQGVSQSAAQQGFAQVANSQQLFAPLPGQQGSALTQAQQAGAVFGTDPGAALKVKQTAAQRTATFAQGGQFTSTSQGFVGIGQATGA